MCFFHGMFGLGLAQLWRRAGGYPRRVVTSPGSLVRSSRSSAAKPARSVMGHDVQHLHQAGAGVCLVARHRTPAGLAKWSGGCPGIVEESRRAVRASLGWKT